MTDQIDPKRFTLTAAPSQSTKSKEPPRHRTGEKFLKGPIPLKWLAKAARQPGKALHVGIMIWFLAGVTRSRTVILSSTLTFCFVASRHSAYRGLNALEAANLVEVIRHPGRSPRITILPLHEDEQ